VPNSSSATPGPSAEPTEPATPESPVAPVASVAVAEPGAAAPASSAADIAADEVSTGAADGETTTADSADIDLPLEDAAAQPTAAGPLSEPVTPPTSPDAPDAPDMPGSEEAGEAPQEADSSGAHRAGTHRWRSLRWLPRPAAAAGQHVRSASRLRLGTLFRVPATDDPTPDNGQLVGICAWATALGLAGLLVAIRGLLGIIGGYATGWYEPALISVGMVGIVLTVLAFMAIQRRYLPWIMLGAATVALGVNIGLTLAAL
jgi:hypothetical protein